MSGRVVHPAVYGALILPFGAVGGFVSVALAFHATTSGLTVEEGAQLIAVGMLPHTWKFLWGPVADTTLTRKRWYLLAGLLCAVGIVAMSAIPLGPSTLRLLQGVIFVTNLATTFLGMAVEGLMAHLTPQEEKGSVSGWFQAGNLGGSGVGGGLGLWMVGHLPAPWMAGAVLAAVFLGCTALLRLLPDVPAEARDRGLAAAVWAVLVDLWAVIRVPSGLLTMLLCFLPIGTGAALGVLAQAEVAARWGAGEAQVGLVNGVLSGVISALGCLAGGWVCTRFPPRAAYAGIGALMAAVAAAMAYGPREPWAFVGFGLVYSFVVGLSFAAFTAFVLDAIGAGAAATKYNVFAALSNTPILYMGLVLASAQTRHGETGMLLTEAGAAVVGILVLAGATALLLGRRRAAVAG